MIVLMIQILILGGNRIATAMARPWTRQFHAGRMSGVTREFVAAIELSVLSLGNKNNNNNAWNSAGSFCEQFMLAKEIAQRNWLRF